MQVKRLGIEWGAAHLEASPIRVKHGSAEIEIYLSEKGEMIIEIPAGGWCEPATVFNKSPGLRVTLRHDD